MAQTKRLLVNANFCNIKFTSHYIFFYINFGDKENPQTVFN